MGPQIKREGLIFPDGAFLFSNKKDGVLFRKQEK